GVSDMYVGVPVIIGSEGVERIVELPLTDKETEMFNQSVDAVKGLNDAVAALS
ncbi:MAG: malate dehydrogenase, partial [Alphaproteobacteria bacterium]|nr:malate dehydrogenase [Alphaproteobacteria bacterium]